MASPNTPKVRTGCITCKKRHVKCDETRPHCQKCLRSRGSCEGYAPAKASEEPREFLQWQQCWDSKQVPPTKQPGVDFGGDHVSLYFNEFVGLVKGPWIIAASHGDFWEVALPQVALTNEALRHAATAIGALSVSRRESGHRKTMHLQTADPGTHMFHAIAHYCRALKIHSQQASTQNAVFLALLLLYFEIARGNRRAALDHVNHGLALLLACLTDAHQIDTFAPDPRPILGAVADIFVQLATQARTVLPDRLGGGSSLPHLEKGLRQKNQTMESFLVLLSQVAHSSMATDHVPHGFDTLDEFETFWIDCRRRQINIIKIMSEAIQSLSPGDGLTYHNFPLALLGNAQIQEFCDNSRETMQALDAAFLPLFNQIILSEPNNSPSYLRAIHLRLHYLGCYVFEDPPQYLSADRLLSRTPLFREYSSLARLALRTAKQQIKHPAQQLSLQCGMAWNLLNLAFLCRDPLVRDEAVSMLKDYPGQDGLWDTRALYVLAARNFVVERQNALEGTAEEQWLRLFRREFVFENGGDCVVFRYLEKDMETGNWGLVEEVAEVHGEGEDVSWKRRPVTGSGEPLMMQLYAALGETGEFNNI